MGSQHSRARAGRINVEPLHCYASHHIDAARVRRRRLRAVRRTRGAHGGKDFSICSARQSGDYLDVYIGLGVSVTGISYRSCALTRGWCDMYRTGAEEGRTPATPAPRLRARRAATDVLCTVICVPRAPHSSDAHDRARTRNAHCARVRACLLPAFSRLAPLYHYL